MFNLIFLEGSMEGLGVLIFLIIMGLFGVPIVLAFIGLILWIKNKKKGAKICWIISVIYVLISLGICGSMM